MIKLYFYLLSKFLFMNSGKNAGGADAFFCESIGEKLLLLSNFYISF